VSHVGGSPRKLKIPVTPQDAARWFLRDMASSSGYVLEPVPGSDPLLAGYGSYRPLLTAPDPWYFAGVIALEVCKVIDFYPPEYSNEVMRYVCDECDRTVGREGTDVASLSMLIMGRLGIGAVLMRGKAPDSVLGKIMTILMGSEKSIGSKMPAPEAHKQLRAALKLGQPVWWRVFRKRYRLSFDPEADLAAEQTLKPLDLAEELAIDAALRAERKKEAVKDTTFAGAMAEFLSNDGVLVLDTPLTEPISGPLPGLSPGLIAEHTAPL
jgi:hypothetical protein